jgi:hypothetical protein
MQAQLHSGAQVSSFAASTIAELTVCTSTTPVPAVPVPTVPEPVPQTPEVDPDESVPLPTFTPDVNPDSIPFPNLPLLDPDEDPNRFGTCRGE